MLSVATSTGDLETATAVIDQLLAIDGLSDGRRARTLEFRAKVRGGEQRYAEGAADADEVCRILASIGAGDALGGAHLLAAMLHEDADAPHEAVVRYRTGIRAIEDRGERVPALRYKLGRALLASGQAEDAVEVVREVFDIETEMELAPVERAQTLMLLARACEQAEQYGNAVWSWNTAAELADEDEATLMAASARTYQGKLLFALGDPDEALAPLEQAVEVARAHPDETNLLTDGLHSLGRVRAALGDESGYALLDEVSALARQLDAPWLAADVMDSRGRALVGSERLDQGIGALLQAADLFTGVGDANGAANSELYAARALAHAGRHDEAVAIFGTLTARGEHVHPRLLAVAQLELGDSLEALGRHGEAAQARAAAEG